MMHAKTGSGLLIGAIVYGKTEMSNSPERIGRLIGTADLIRRMV